MPCPDSIWWKIYKGVKAILQCKIQDVDMAHVEKYAAKVNYPSIFEKSATANVASLIRFNSFRRFSR